MSRRPVVDDKAIASIKAIAGAVGDTISARMVLCPYGGILYWLGHGPEVHEAQKAWAEELVAWLNKEVWLDGFWTVLWCDWDYQRGLYTRAVMAYLDRDCDLQFTVDIEDHFNIAILAIPDYVEAAENAYHAKRRFLAEVGVTASDQIKAALGEKSKNRWAQPEFDVLSMT